MEVNGLVTMPSGEFALISQLRHRCGKGAFPPIALASPKFIHGARLNLDVEVSKPRLKLVASARRTENNDRGQSLRGSTAEERIRTNHAPHLEPQSTARRCLEETLRRNAELSLAARKQLELLAKDRQAHDKLQLQKLANSSCEGILHRRIAEVKAKDRAKAVEEIMHALVVNSFRQAGIPMVSTSSLVTSNRTMDLQSIEDQNLEALHSPLVQEMVKHHVAMVIGGMHSDPHRIYDPNKPTLICRTRMGQIYAASVMYGYFLRRVLGRLRLDQRVQTLDIQKHAVGNGYGINARHHAYPLGVMKGVAEKGNVLAAYVMSFHEETLKQNAKIRTREGVEVIERHAYALFGKPLGLHGAQVGEPLPLRIWVVQRLALEALAFGNFLWDVEECVELHYALTFEN